MASKRQSNKAIKLGVVEMTKRYQKYTARAWGQFLLIPASLFLFGCNQELYSGEEFPGPWIEGASPAIDRVLQDHNVMGCDRATYRTWVESEGPLDPRGVFLLYCRPANGTEWTSWIVRPELADDEELIGPDPIRDDVPPPEG